MQKAFKHKSESEMVLAELMTPNNSNFSGKIHGGYILSKMDAVAFACASKHSGHYCVTASVNTVDFLAPIEVGELVSMKAMINYVGTSSMVVGIRVESENIHTGEVKHCNSSYFTMVAKSEDGSNAKVPGIILESSEDVRRFLRSIERKRVRKIRSTEYGSDGFDLQKHIKKLEGHNVSLKLPD
ncbi:MAG: acyl-CoA thioesterase [Salibacteraceae bacterium]